LTKTGKIAYSNRAPEGKKPAKKRGQGMKQLEIFQKAVKDTPNYARDLKKEKGKKQVGYLCSYTPEEIILAAGAHPLRLMGTKENIQLADTHLQSYCCSLVRGVLEEGLSRRLEFLDGLVFPHTCDSIQRLSDIWRMNIPFGFHLDVVLPVKLNTESAKIYLGEVLEKFRRELGQALNIAITEEDLKKAIRIMQAIREALQAIYTLRSQNPELLAGKDLNVLMRGSMIVDREELAVLLPEIVNELNLKAGEAGNPSLKRVVLAGGICNHQDIYPIVENAGGAIVWDDLCTGSRVFAEPVKEGIPAMEALTARAFNRLVCPAKHRDLFGRAENILRIVRENQAQGVIFLMLKFCDPHAFDYPYLKQNLDEAGIPSLLLEIEDPLPSLGPLKTRLEAFLEML
jgi:benzoyl-CoA reductase subunit C